MDEVLICELWMGEVLICELWMDELLICEVLMDEKIKAPDWYLVLLWISHRGCIATESA